MHIHTPTTDPTQTQAQYYNQYYSTAAPASSAAVPVPVAAPIANEGDWDRLDAYFQILRGHARAFTFSTAGITELNNALMRLYAEAESAAMYTNATGAQSQPQESYGGYSHGVDTTQARAGGGQAQVDMSSYMPMASGAVVPHSTFP